jgi:hypothetical protein
MITLEHSLIISSIAISVTYCFVTICRQVQHSKCTHIQFCCCSIDRDVTNNEPEPDPVSPINPSISALIDAITPQPSRSTTPRPRLSHPRVSSTPSLDQITSSRPSSPTHSLMTATVKKLLTSQTHPPEEIV